MFYLVYKITNVINGKFYIGCHKTSNIDDGYMGSGKLIRKAIDKYGIENFNKEILVECATSEEMFEKERELVIICDQSYNLKEGGEGGFDYLNSSKLNTSWKDAEDRSRKISYSIKEKWKNDSDYSRADRKQLGVRSDNFIEASKTSFLGKTHSAETRKKISTSNAIRQCGSNNSQYGTMWITDGKFNKKIRKDDIIPLGWKAGRTLK